MYQIRVTACNSFDEPERVKPVAQRVDGISSDFRIALLPHSMNVVDIELTG